ncbi:tetratricopeptide repeat protein [Desulfosudis oleivorans]|uniref:Tetratricopeptide repeat protein n=1 Tax=Desulfosudis oleivorans (strain DSM 6200 / JCM 39069 / Hxd3) TaxID=96561 RepID=A8ZX28_DESOH|nr:hypothetical protein [Desulfosudis oleivorans]ABW66884.1 hypothetical protein Dole_1075 [Desulfosudis oleivorans Hxd3]
MKNSAFNLTLRVIVVIVMLCAASPVLGEYDWDIKTPIPSYDPLWDTFSVMWENRWEGENTDEMISLLEKLETKYSDRIEPCLFLGRCYYIKGLHQLSERHNFNKIAETYAVKAYKIDNDNFHAFFLLLNALSSREDYNYIMSNYGEWIHAMSPLKELAALPDLPPSEAWHEARKNWEQKHDIAHLRIAIKQIEAIAKKNPNDGLSQLWACQAYYKLGDYYMQQGEHKKMGVPNYQIAMEYAEKALKLMPYSVEAHYWYQLSLSRKIQVANIFTKALYLNTLMDHLIFCIQENALYEFGGPVDCVATMIVEGGWVCEKAMDMAGFNMNIIINMLQTNQILFPDNTYNAYITAVLMDNENREQEALAVLEELLKKGPPAPDHPNRNNALYIHAYNLSNALHEKLVSEIKS